MNVKLVILTLCLLCVICSSRALAKEEPIIYTVKQGDTLWDISQRFIKDPFYWPNLWSHNPKVGNPHLIYPGQKLRIYDGRIEIIPVGEEVGDVATGLVTPEEIFLIPTYGGAQSFISKEEIETLGTLVDTVDNRVMVTTGDTVFLEMNDLNATKPGDIYELISIGPSIIHPMAEGTFGHQTSKKVIGYQTFQLGTVEISEVTPHVAVATITSALREIQRGAKLRPYSKIPDRIPRLLADSVIEGYILANDVGNVAMGQWEVILVDMGKEIGVQVGHELDIYRERQATEQVDKSKELTLPDIDLGDAIILEVRKGFAEALITRTTNLPIYRGDQVRTKTN